MEKVLLEEVVVMMEGVMVKVLSGEVMVVEVVVVVVMDISDSARNHKNDNVALVPQHCNLMVV